MKVIKKPIEVNAWQIKDLDIDSVVPSWVISLMFDTHTIFEPHNKPNMIGVHTLEGDMFGNVGDYLIQGNHDDVWIVKREIFEDTYEMVEDE